MEDSPLFAHVRPKAVPSVAASRTSCSAISSGPLIIGDVAEDEPPKRDPAR